jgi:hypothetical protein
MKMLLLCFCTVCFDQQIWSDMRYLSLPEDRRIELFNEFISDLKQQTAAADAAAAAASLASSRIGSPAAAQSVPPGSLNILGGSSGSSIDALSSGGSMWDDGTSTVDEANMSPEDLAQLQLLRWEQAKLRAEYLKMEEKLRAMEIKMVKSRPASPAAAAAASPTSTPGTAAAADLTIHIEVDQAHGGAAGGGNGAGSAAADVREEPHTPQVPAAASPSALAAAAAAAAAAAQQQEVDVVVAGGDGDVSVEEENGVLVFKFSESRAGSRAASRRSTQEEF